MTSLIEKLRDGSNGPLQKVAGSVAFYGAFIGAPVLVIVFSGMLAASQAYHSMAGERAALLEMRALTLLNQAVARERDTFDVHGAHALLGGNDANGIAITHALARVESYEQHGPPGTAFADAYTHFDHAWELIKAHATKTRFDDLTRTSEELLLAGFERDEISDDADRGIRTLAALGALEYPMLERMYHRLNTETLSVLRRRPLTFPERVRDAATLSLIESAEAELHNGFSTVSRTDPEIAAPILGNDRALARATTVYSQTVHRIVYGGTTGARVRKRDRAALAKTAAIAENGLEASAWASLDALGITIEDRVKAAYWHYGIINLACGLGLLAIAYVLYQLGSQIKMRSEEKAKHEEIERQHRSKQLEVYNIERALAAKDKMMRAIFERATIGIATLDLSGSIFNWNPELERLLGDKKVDIIGDYYQEYEAVLAGKRSVLNFEAAFTLANGGVLWASVTISRIDSDASGIAMCMFQDITERKNAEVLLQYEATHDGLTGLANRTLFRSRLAEIVSTNEGEAYSVLFIDLDLFKYVNDTYGHAAGDTVLTTVSERLRQIVSENDTVARFGGDEFAIVLAPPTSLSYAENIAMQIAKRIAEPIPFEEHLAVIGSSVGLVLGPANYQQAEDVMRDADTAMYAAKSGGRGRYIVFDPKMQESAHRRAQLSNDLQVALEDESQLHVLYQPIVSLSGMRIAGFEALVRWRHPILGEVDTEDFVKVAEQSGLVRNLGRFVMQRAFTQLKELGDRYAPALGCFLSVNISASELSTPNFVESVVEVVRSTDFNPDRLYLEITESNMIVSGEQANRIISRLREFGIRISIDDFGAGYSSLRYLQDLDVDLLKVDRGFLKDQARETGQSGETILRAIINLSAAFDLAVVAEGIERPEQLLLVRSLGCQYGQGQLWGKPLDIDGVEATLREENETLPNFEEPRILESSS